MKFKDYYQILGVPETASQDEIKRAYRKKARLYHPDVSKDPDAEEKFKSVNEAHEALRDEKRRAEYDQLKKYGYRQGDDFQRPPDWGGSRYRGSGHQGAGGFGSGSFGGGDFGDFFESIFGASAGGPAGGFHRSGQQQSARPVRKKGMDVSLKIQVDVEIAYRGGKTTVTVPSVDGQPGKSLSVKIPPGSVNGKLLRIRGQGRPGSYGGGSGDLILTIRLRRHEIFSVDGEDVVVDVPVTPLESIDGVRVTVPTLGGEVALAIPPNTRGGTKMRLRGRGLTDKGDQLVNVQVQLPQVLTARGRELLQEFEKESELKPRAQTGEQENQGAAG